MRLNDKIVDLFQVPVLVLDKDLVIIDCNEQYAALFGNVLGQPFMSLCEDFNERKFSRKINAGQDYECTQIPVNEKRTQYSINLKLHEDQYIGIATNTSAFAKYEAMLESYSGLIDKQNKEIKAKTAQLNIWRTRIERELEQANTVQELLVPRHLNTKHIDSRCEHLQELSGDFHELAHHIDGQDTFIIGDVAGKGIYAAMMLAQTLTAFRASYQLPRLRDVAVNIVKMLEDRFPDGLFVAFTLMRQSADKKTVTILNLGNPDALIIGRHGITAEIPSVGPAIGIFPASIYEDLEESEFDLSDQRLYIFSDGVMDINRGDDHDDFTSSREIGEYLDHLYKSNPGGELDDIVSLVQANKQIDDVTIAVITP